MQNESNQYELNLILQDFQKGLVKECIIKIKEYIKIIILKYYIFYNEIQFTIFNESIIYNNDYFIYFYEKK